MKSRLYDARFTEQGIRSHKPCNHAEYIPKYVLSVRQHWLDPSIFLEWLTLALQLSSIYCGVRTKDQLCTFHLLLIAISYAEVIINNSKSSDIFAKWQCSFIIDTNIHILLQSSYKRKFDLPRSYCDKIWFDTHMWIVAYQSVQRRLWNTPMPWHPNKFYFKLLWTIVWGIWLGLLGI